MSVSMSMSKRDGRLMVFIRGCSFEIFHRLLACKIGPCVGIDLTSSIGAPSDEFGNICFDLKDIDSTFLMLLNKMFGF